MSFFYITYAPKDDRFSEIRDEQYDEHLQTLRSAGYEIEFIDRANWEMLLDWLRESGATFEAKEPVAGVPTFSVSDSLVRRAFSSAVMPNFANGCCS